MKNIFYFTELTYDKNLSDNYLQLFFRLYVLHLEAFLPFHVYNFKFVARPLLQSNCVLEVAIQK